MKTTSVALGVYFEDFIKAKIAQLNELVAAAEKATGEEEMVKVAEKIGEVGTDIFAHSDGFLQL